MSRIQGRIVNQLATVKNIIEVLDIGGEAMYTPTFFPAL